MAALPALCILVLACAGCSREPAHAPFYRFVEDVVPGDRWHETEVRIANETRNVLFAPYRSEPSEVEVSADGTIPLGAVVDIEKVSAGAVGVRIGVERLADKGDDAETDKSPRYTYVSLPAERDPDALARTRVRVLPADGDTQTAIAWAREVIPLPQEYVTKPVRVPPSARLDFGFAFEDEKPDAAVRFTVSVHRGGMRRTVFTQTLDPLSTGFEAGWVDASVDLSEFAGSRVRFVFRTENISGDRGPGTDSQVPSYSSPVWSNPVMYSTEAEKEDAHPNVVLISLDTLRADHLGCYGYYRDTSPNIDEFAEDAFLFENAIAPSTWTLPSHVSVFTGLPVCVHQSGISTLVMAGRETTLAELARQHGYITAAYTEGVLVRSNIGFAQGFDLYSDGDMPSTPPLAPGFAEKTFGDALQWIKEYRNLPFLLFVHTYQTHGPYTPPGRFASMFDSDYMGPVGRSIFVARRKGFTDADKTHFKALYDGEIAYTDEVVGNFLNELRRMGVLDNSVVIVFSDHGEEFWEHGGVGHAHALYDEQLRVPLIVRLAGQRHTTGRVKREVCLTDLYATVVEILGIDHDCPPDSMSLLPLMEGKEPGGRYDRKTVLSEIREVGPEAFLHAGDRPLGKFQMRAVRTDDEKYISSEKWQTEEFYDLRADPGEKDNIATQSQSRLERYRELLDSFLQAAASWRAPSAPAKPGVPALTAEDRRRLKALGYM